MNTGLFNTSSDAVLVAEQLTKTYSVSKRWGRSGTVSALNSVSLSVKKGKTLAIVGESGSGKSTLARQLTMVEPPTSGKVWIGGIDIWDNRQAKLASVRREVQLVFQNPLASLNPRKTVKQILTEPLVINTGLSPHARQEHIEQTMEIVGLRAEYANRYGHMFSGGQRQRIAIARAMILSPKIVVADEPVSALDVSIQAQILNLFKDIQNKFGTAYVFISHNLSVVEYIADDVMVMYFGSVVEAADKAALFEHPRHPYTRALLSATPMLFRRDNAQKMRLQGEMPSPINPPVGCAFHLRCPYVVDRCRKERPLLRQLGEHRVACHRAEEIE